VKCKLDYKTLSMKLLLVKEREDDVIFDFPHHRMYVFMCFSTMHPIECMLSYVFFDHGLHRMFASLQEDIVNMSSIMYEKMKVSACKST